MFKLTTKNVARGYSYVYAQRSERISSTKVKTESYSLGNVHDFIARLNSKLVGSKTYTYSGEVCLSEIAKRIDIDKCANKYLSKLPDESKYNLPNYLLTLAVHHILNQSSKSQCREWYKTSYMQVITKLPEIAFHKNNIYYYMDKFYKYRHKIFKEIRDSAIHTFKIDTSEVIFDTTSVLFRVSDFVIDDSFRRYGNSKDKRFDLLQFVLAIGSTLDGFPIYYRTYPGNTSDFHAFKNFLNDFETDIKPIFKGNMVWIIFDKGNTSKKTIQKLDKISEKSENYCLAYVTSVKLDKNMLKELNCAEMCVVDKRKYMVLERFPEIYGGVKRLLIVYDPNLKNEQTIKLMDKYQKVKSQLDQILKGKMNLTKQITHMHDIVKKQNLTTVFKIEITNKKATYFIDESAKEKLFMKARTFGILTNNFTDNKSTIIYRYIGRNKIEEVIREIKTDIPVRPVYHHLKRRIKTHVLFVMVGYLLLSVAKIFLKKKMLNITTKKLLSIFHTGWIDIIKWNEKITAEYPKNVDGELKKIYKSFGLSYLNM